MLEVVLVKGLVVRSRVSGGSSDTMIMCELEVICLEMLHEVGRSLEFLCNRRYSKLFFHRCSLLELIVATAYCEIAGHLLFRGLHHWVTLTRALLIKEGLRSGREIGVGHLFVSDFHIARFQEVLQISLFDRFR